MLLVKHGDTQLVFVRVLIVLHHRHVLDAMDAQPVSCQRQIKQEHLSSTDFAAQRKQKTTAQSSPVQSGPENTE
jgi:hypothetical protein